MKLLQGFGILLIWGQVIGMLGTVYGMIQAFESIGVAGGTADPAEMANNISISLISTQIGLLMFLPGVAITTLATRYGEKGPDNISTVEYVPQLLAALFLGKFGVHRFLVGRWQSGLLMLLTFGGLGIWWLLDITFLCLGKFTDKEKLPIFCWRQKKAPA